MSDDDQIKCPECGVEAEEIGTCLCCGGIRYRVVHADHSFAGADIWTACSPACPRASRRDALYNDFQP